MKITNAELLKKLTNEFPMENRITCILPENFHSTKAIEALKIHVEPIEGSELCMGTLPKGWSISYRKVGNKYEILNEMKVARAEFWFTSINLDTHEKFWNPGFVLLCRYDIKNEDDDHRGTYWVQVVDNETKQIVYNAGYARIFSQEYDVLLQKATEFLNLYYPEWNNPVAYWD